MTLTALEDEPSICGMTWPRASPDVVVGGRWEDRGMGAGVLIVDDDAQFRLAARRLLESGGFSIVGEADHGAAALAAVRRLAPAVVLLDVQLPDMDGFEVCRRLALESAPVAVILVSSRPVTAYRGRLERSLALGFIAKEDLTGTAVKALLE